MGSGGSGGSAEGSLPALGAQGGMARQRGRNRIHRATQHPKTCPRRRTAGAPPPTRPCAKRAQPRSPRSQPRLPSPRATTLGLADAGDRAPSASGTGGGAGMGRPVLGHTEGEPGGEHWACPSTQTQTLGSVSAGHQVGDKTGGVMGSSGPRKPGEVAACPAWRPAWLLTRPGHPQDAPAPWAARGHAAAATRSLGPARSRAALGQVSGQPHALCVHSDLAPTPLHDQPSVPPCRPSRKRW